MCRTCRVVDVVDRVDSVVDLPVLGPGAPGTGPDPVIDQDDKAPESCTNAGHESTMYFRDQRYKRNRSVSIPVLECFVRVLVAV